MAFLLINTSVYFIQKNKPTLIFLINNIGLLKYYLNIFIYETQIYYYFGLAASGMEQLPP